MVRSITRLDELCREVREGGRDGEKSPSIVYLVVHCKLHTRTILWRFVESRTSLAVRSNFVAKSQHSKGTYLPDVRQVRNAARVIGDPTLYRKMEATSQLIKRDIVFAASLYVA